MGTRPPGGLRRIGGWVYSPVAGRSRADPLAQGEEIGRLWALGARVPPRLPVLVLVSTGPPGP
jgi:hypothetical protein